MYGYGGCMSTGMNGFVQGPGEMVYGLTRVCMDPLYVSKRIA